MGRFLTLLGLALLTIAEVGAVMWLYDQLGPTGALTVLGLDMFFGVLLIRRAATSPDPTNRGWKLTGGFFVALPGLVLDLVGLALWFPPTRCALARILRRNVDAAAARSGVSVITVTGPDGGQVTAVVQGDVISGEVLVPHSNTAPGSGAQTADSWAEDGQTAASQSGAGQSGAGQSGTGQSGAGQSGTPSRPRVIRGEILPGTGGASGESDPKG